MALTPNDRERLIKLLGMIGSNADGEALNAARLAHKLLQDRGMTWRQVVGGNGAVSPPFINPWGSGTWHHTPPPPPPPSRGSERWRTVADFILNYKDEMINEWEYHFLESIIARPGGLTQKQMATLVKIGQKCGVIVD